MAEVFVAAAAGAVGSSISGAIAGSLALQGALGIVGAQLTGALVGAVASSAISTVLSGALGLNRTPKAAAFTAAAQDRQQMIRSAVANRQIVLGRAVVSGPIVYGETTGDGNKYLHLVIPLAHGESEEIGDIWYGDELVGSLDGGGNVTSGRFAGRMRVLKHLGSSTQAADAVLVTESAEWSADHRGRGITYIYVRLEYHADTYPIGLENIKAQVKGRKLYDPRTGLTAWSENWALCVRTWLADIDGLRADAGEIDDDAIIAAANISDEAVTTPSAGTEARYTCNGTIDTGGRPIDILRALLSAGAGRMVYSGGRFVVAAGAYVTPTVTLDEDDLRGPITLRARTPRQELFNRVRGTFVSPENYWQPADFPAIENATYETQDGEQITTDIELPYTTGSFAAQRLAKVVLERARQGITVNMPCKLGAFRVRAGDFVRLSIAQLGWSEKVFLVTAWQMQPDGGIDLELREEAAATYSWSSGEATVVDPAPDTNLPSLTYVAPPTSLVAYSGAAYQLAQPDGVRLCRIYLTWVSAADAQIISYEIQHKLTTDSVWSSATVAASTVTAYLAPVVSGSNYQIRVRSINLRGSASAWAGPVTILASSDASTVATTVSYGAITGAKPPVNADNTSGAINAGTSVTSGGITFNAGGAIKGGQTAFNVGTGWFLGYEGGFYKFSVGSGSGNRLTFDQSTGEIELVGKVSGQLIQTVRSEAASNATINTSWTILQGFPVTVQGSKVVIDIAVFQANGTCKYRVLRDTTVLAYWPATGNFVGNHWITHRIEDSPAPGGLHTYFLEAIQSSGSGTGLAQERSLRVEDWR